MKKLYIKNNVVLTMIIITISLMLYGHFHSWVGLSAFFFGVVVGFSFFEELESEVLKKK